MASASLQNCDWEEDDELCEILRRLVLQNFKRMEVLDFARRDFRNTLGASVHLPVALPILEFGI